MALNLNPSSIAFSFRSCSLPSSLLFPAPDAPPSDDQLIRSFPSSFAGLSARHPSSWLAHPLRPSVPFSSQIFATSSVTIRLSHSHSTHGVVGTAPPSISESIHSDPQGHPISSPEIFLSSSPERPARLGVRDLVDLYEAISSPSQPELPSRLILDDLGVRTTSSSFFPELPVSLGIDSLAANFCGVSSAVQELPVSSVAPLPCKNSAVHGHDDAKQFFEQALQDPVHVAVLGEKRARPAKVVGLTGYSGPVAAPIASESRKLIPGPARQITNADFGFQTGLAPIPENEIPTFDAAPTPLFSILSRLSKSQAEIEDKIKNVHEGNVFLCGRFNLLSNETMAKIENVQQSAGRAVQHAIARVSALETRNADKDRDFALSEARKEEEMKKMESAVKVLKEEIANRKVKIAENREKSRKLWKYGAIGIGGLLVAGIGATLLWRKN